MRDGGGDVGSLINTIASFIITHGYSYPVDMGTMSNADLQTTLPRGLVDVNMVANTIRFGDWYDEATANGSITNLGRTHQASQSFVIPKWMHEEYRINTIHDMRFQWGRFADSAGSSRGLFFTCGSESITKCGEINEIKMEAYGLALHFDLVWPGSGAGLRAILENAQENADPLFGYHSAPSAIMGSGYWYVLEEPAYTDACWAVITAAQEHSSLRPIGKACAYEQRSLDKYVWPGLLEKAPDVWRLLRNMSFEAEHLSQTLAWASVNEDEETWERAAAFYLQNYLESWRFWMPEENFGRVLAALS